MRNKIRKLVCISANGIMLCIAGYIKGCLDNSPVKEGGGSMSVDNELEAVFKEIGLSGIHARVYAGLVYLGGRATANDLSRKTGLPVNTVYKALKELESRGLVTALATRPKTYVIQSVKDTLLNVVRKKAEELLSRAEGIAATLESIMSVKGMSYEPVHLVIEGWNNVSMMIRLLIQRAKSEILMFAPYDLVLGVEEYLDEAMRRGVYISIVASKIFPPVESSILTRLKRVSDILRFRWHGTRLIMCVDGLYSLIAPISPHTNITMAIKASYIEDKDIAHIVSSYFYHRVVASSIKVYHGARPGSKKTFKIIQSAIDYISEAIKNKYEVHVSVKGYDTLTGKEIDIKGLVHGILIKPHKGLYSLAIDTGGTIYTIGGYRAFIEDISASEIEVEIREIIRS